MTQKSKPLFISFEGGEGSGKSTLIKGLYSSLKKEGFEVFKTREPGGTTLGEEIREILLHQKEHSISSMAELLLFLTSRAQHIQEVIQPHLDKGHIVLCDRFNDSTIAYQGIARGVGKEKAQELCNLACQGLSPNLTFILDLDPSKGLKRIEKMDKKWDRLEDLKLSFHQKVHQGYHTLAKEEPSRIHLIDATMSKKEVFEKAWGPILKNLS